MITVVQIPVLMWSAKGREWFSLIFFIGFYLFNSLFQFYIQSKAAVLWEACHTQNQQHRVSEYHLHLLIAWLSSLIWVDKDFNVMYSVKMALDMFIDIRFAISNQQLLSYLLVSSQGCRMQSSVDDRDEGSSVNLIILFIYVQRLWY